MTLAGLEPAIFGSEDQSLIHQATGPTRSSKSLNTIPTFWSWGPGPAAAHEAPAWHVSAQAPWLVLDTYPPDTVVVVVLPPPHLDESEGRFQWRCGAWLMGGWAQWRGWG